MGHDAAIPLHDAVVELEALRIAVDPQRRSDRLRLREALVHPFYFYEATNRAIYQCLLELEASGSDVCARSTVLAWLASYPADRMDAVLDRIRKSLVAGDGITRVSYGDQRFRGHGPSQLPANEPVQASVLERLDPAVVDLLYTPTDADVEPILEVLQEFFTRRYLSTLTTTVDRRIKSLGPAERVDTVVHEWSRAIKAITAPSAGTITALGALSGVLDLDAGDSYPTGYVELDDLHVGILGGLQPGGLYVVAARPGCGKTSFALSLVRNFASDAAPSLFFSMEVDQMDVLRKLICIEDGTGDLTHRLLSISGSIDQARHGRARVAGLLALLRAWPVHIVDDGGMTGAKLALIAERFVTDLRQAGSTRVPIFIDYLQLLEGAKNQTEYERVSENTRLLKKLARTLHVPIVCLSQLNRDSEKDHLGRPPRMSSLRGSGSIEQDADAIIFLHRPQLLTGDNQEEARIDENAGRQVQVIVAKNRFGPVGISDFLFDAPTGRFYGGFNERLLSQRRHEHRVRWERHFGLPPLSVPFGE